MNSNLLDDFSLENKANFRRRALIPVWMKIFIWIFMVVGVFVIPVFIAGILGYNIQLELYGFKANTSLSAMGILLLILFLFKGLVSYLLWFEKELAINMGIIDAVVGILICILSMIGFPFISLRHPSFSFRVEIILLIPYLLKLKSMKSKWNASEY